jgi:hypothetical protein
VYAVGSKRADAREDERGFTLPELLTTLAIFWALDRTEQEEGPHRCLIRQANPCGPGGPRPAISGQDNGRTQTLVTQVALGNRMW